MLEKTLESPLYCKEIQPVHPKGDQSWVFIGRTDDEAETPILCAPDVKNWLIWKDLMLGKIEGRRRRGWQRMRWLGGITDSMDVSLSKFREMVKGREVWHAAVHGVSKSWTQLSKWTTGLESLSSSSAKLGHPECLGPIRVGQRTLSWMKVYSDLLLLQTARYGLHVPCNLVFHYVELKRDPTVQHLPNPPFCDITLVAWHWLYPCWK